MKATINGIEVEGTKEEIVELIQMFGKQDTKQFIPIPYPSPYIAPVQPYIGTPFPTTPTNPPWKFGDIWCGSGFVEAKRDPNVIVLN